MPKIKLYNNLFPISSLIYRASIILLSVIVVISETNIWNIWVYVTFGGIYLGGLIVCYNVKHAESRSLLDFALINLFLWEKNISDPFNYFYVITPMLSSVFYTGKHRSIISIWILTEVSILIHFINGIHLTWIIPPFMLYLISFLYENRRQWLSYSQDINLKIDDFFCKPESIREPHKILKPIIFQLRSITKKKCIRDISIYIIKSDSGIYLINSSKFKWERRLYLSSTELEYLYQNKTIIRNIENSTSNHKLAERLCLVIIEDSRYIVKYEYSPNNRLWFLMKLGFSNFLETLAGKIARMIDLRHKIITQQDTSFSEFRKSKKYIDRAIGVMHFIRNKLTPMLNVLEYENLSDSEKALIRDKQFKNALKAAKNDINDIQSRAKSLLDTSNYPFPEYDNENITIKELFTLLSESAEGRMDISVTFIGEEPKRDYVFKGNKAEINVLFTDWISNMEKYGENQKIEFSLNGEVVLIKFYNTTKKVDVSDVVTAINSTSIKTSLTRKKTHGVYTMKEIAQTYKISMHAEQSQDNIISDKQLLLDLKIPVYEYTQENIDN